VEISKRLGCLKNGAEDVKQHRYLSEVDWKKLYEMGMKAPYIPEIK